MARILLVDDEHSDRLLLETILKGAGHQIFTATDGEQAFKTYLRTNIEVIVTDLHMPKVDGLELIEGLLGLYPGTAIIAVTGKGPELLAEAVRMGVSAGFSKPVDADKLLRAVESAIANGDAGGFA